MHYEVELPDEICEVQNEPPMRSPAVQIVEMFEKINDQIGIMPTFYGASSTHTMVFTQVLIAPASFR